MKLERPLYLHEEVLLLALRDHDGKVPCGAGNFKYAVGGALVVELLLTGRIELRHEGRKTFVELGAGGPPTGDAVLDECLHLLRTARRRAQLKRWVARFAAIPGLKHHVARGLCRLGVLRAEEDTILFLFRRRRYPEVEREPEQEVLDRLYAALFDPSTEPTERTATLVSLAAGSGLLRLHFGRACLKTAKGRLEALAARDEVGAAVKQVVREMETTIAAAAAAGAAAGAG